MKYQPIKKSVKKHEVPAWFHDAKLGIFVHWGLYSVPAFAVTGMDLIETIKEQGFAGQFKKNPYAEWYMNSLSISGSPTREYHEETYGRDFKYEDFAPMFNDAIEKWNPQQMAELFKDAGAKYVVLVTKHHDGFLLWPSDHPHPEDENYHASRDIVGELTEAVKKEGMKMGFYYSGTLDWSFQEESIKDMISFITNGVMDPEYVEYDNNNWHELIEKHDPLILWNDIGYPPNTNVYEIFADFYNKHEEGVINDRWMQLGKWTRKIIKFKPIAAIVKWVARRAFIKGSAGMPTTMHHDFRTPEYTHFEDIKDYKWESTRGIGNSFGYNKFEKEEDYLTSEALIRMFVDIVSKNGNLLINVGPKADGSIPEAQKKCLSGLGKWLKINGEAIYGTRPWKKAEAHTEDGIEIRFTQDEEHLYAFTLERPQGKGMTIKKLKTCPYGDVKLLGHDELLKWERDGKDLKIFLPEVLPDGPVLVFSFSPKYE